MKHDSVRGKVSFFTERTIAWDDNSNTIRMIDQTRLPGNLVFFRCRTVSQVVDAIKTMKIRGAPAIGVAGAMGTALSVLASKASSRERLMKDIETDCIALKSARPTAVNLAWGVDKVVDLLESETPEKFANNEVGRRVVAFVKELAERDVSTNKKLSDVGEKLFRDDDGVLTHCK